MLNFIIQSTSLKLITINFPLKVHTEHYGDAFHSMTARQAKSAKIFEPWEWATMIRNTPLEVNKIHVYELCFQEFYDVKRLQDEHHNFTVEHGETVLN